MKIPKIYENENLKRFLKFVRRKNNISWNMLFMWIYIYLRMMDLNITIAEESIITTSIWLSI